MDVQEQYDKIINLKEILKASPTVSSFLETSQQELFSVFDKPFLGTTKHTKKSLLDLLDTEQSKLALSLQSACLQAGFHDKKISPLKETLERKRKEKMAGKNYLYMILQLACSHPEYFFLKNFESDISQKELIDYVVVDPNKVPQGFLDAFQIASVDVDGKNIKQLFKSAKPLYYRKDTSAMTWRVVFIDGKLVVFRELQQLLHKEKKLTQGEKRRVDYKKYFNTFDDIYSAIRSQMHIVDQEDDKIEKYKDVQENMIELLQTIRSETKHGEEQRKLKEIIHDVKNAKTFNIMAAAFYNLFKIDFYNKSIVSKHLEGSGNKISKERYRLSSIVSTILTQTDALDDLLFVQDNAFQMFLAQLGKSFHNHRADDFLYAFEEYYKRLTEIPQKTEPFLSMERRTRESFGSLQDIARFVTSSDVSERVQKAEMLIALQFNYFQAYQLEHKIKLGTLTRNDVSFAVGAPKRYPDIGKEFSAIVGIASEIQESLLTKPLNESKEHSLSLLQKLQKLPDWERIAHTLKNL